MQPMHTLEQLRSGALAGARRLDLAADLDTFPPEVFELADTLEVLNLSGNRLTTLPHDLNRLHRLKVVFASGNPFTVLPEALGDCPSLEMVGFKSCRLVQVPEASLPPRLRWLTLTDNHISAIPRLLGECFKLQKLMLAGNHLSALPDSLAGAHRLELIRLSANGLTQLPGWLTELPALAWLALSGNPLGWPQAAALAPLPAMPWGQLHVGDRLGEGASGQVVRVQPLGGAGELALKLFKGAVTSDGLPEHELAACRAAGQHPALCTPVAELADHPQGLAGLLLPLIAPSHTVLAHPPSLDSCTRDVYPDGLRLRTGTVLHLARQMAGAVAHLHACGVVHGDVYAHNILWNPTTGQATLTDLGAATLLPRHDPALARALTAVEVRAFGVLLAELLALATPAADTGPSPADGRGAQAERLAMQALAQACLSPVPAERPSMPDVVACLSTIDAATDAAADIATDSSTTDLPLLT
jgi:hypothetical protein